MLHTLAVQHCVDTYRLQSSHWEHEKLATTAVEDVYKEIEKLPAKCHAIFKLLFCDQQSPSEIASQLNINTKTVSSQKRRATKLLRLRLAKNADFIRYAAYINKTDKIIQQ